MNEIQQQISKSISWLRFPLVLMVVFIHCSGIGFDGTNGYDLFHLTEMGAFNMFRMLVSQILCQVAVPLFFVISGYLFYTRLDKWDWNIWKNKINSRVYTLLIPYLSWNLFRFLYNESFAILQSLRHGMDFKSCVLSSCSKITPRIFFDYGITDTGYINWNNELTMMSTPVHTPFWYIRDLIILYIAHSKMSLSN